RARALALPRAAPDRAGVARASPRLRPPGMARPEPARPRGPAGELLAHRPGRERELGARPGGPAAPAAPVALPGVADRGLLAGALPAPAPRLRLLSLERQVLVGRGVGVAGDEAEPRLPHARAHPVEERQLPDRGVHRPLDHHLLDALQRRLAALGVGIGGLLLHEPVDVGIPAVGVHAGAGPELLEAGGRVAEGAARALDQVAVLLVRVAAEEGGALERPDLGP